MSLNTKPQRIDKDFEEDMRKAAKIRLQNNLAQLKYNELSLREMTRLLRRTSAYKQSLFELHTKPKAKENT